MTQPISIYQSPDGSINLDVQVEKETIWLSQTQMANIFWVTTSAINQHIKNIYKESELQEIWTIKKILMVREEWKRSIKREIDHYNLDMIISVWYRVNSKVATHFRQRATQTLRSHIVDGYTFNTQRLEQRYGSQALQEIQSLQQKFQNTNLALDDIIAVTKAFDTTWTSLDAYDKSSLPTSGYTPDSIHLEVQKLYQDISVFKNFLISQSQATGLFAQEKEKGSLEGIFWSVFQSAFGSDAYPTLEEKAAHLLYFIIKNHPFNDGNKRAGAFSFIRFLTKVWYNFRSKITPEALTALTLLIAQSDPKDKSQMTGLVILLLKQ